MAGPLFISLAAEVLPLDFPSAGGAVSGGVGKIPEGHSAPVLLAVLFVVTSLALIIVFSRRRHRKRKIRLPRNPTLAETGGLPPSRSEQ